MYFGLTRDSHDYNAEVRRPFIVYGTLRPGCGNYEWALQGFTTKELTVTVHEYSLYTNGGFPYAVPTEGAKMTATLVYITDEDYLTTMENMDQLEGYTPGRTQYNLYNRIVQECVLEDGTTVEGYMYTPSDPENIRATLPVIESGDWMTREIPAPRSHRSPWSGTSKYSSSIPKANVTEDGWDFDIIEFEDEADAEHFAEKTRGLFEFIEGMDDDEDWDSAKPSLHDEIISEDFATVNDILQEEGK